MWWFLGMSVPIAAKVNGIDAIVIMIAIADKKRPIFGLLIFLFHDEGNQEQRDGNDG
jgi:hypothetical protein